MTRFGPRTLVLAIGALLIASCDRSPTQPDATATAVYFAAEPKPGQVSVTTRSLSTVLGTPTQVSG